jgi:hypothetical protein
VPNHSDSGKHRYADKYNLTYTASRSTAVGTTLTGGFDFEPPDTTNADIKNLERTERACNQYREHLLNTQGEVIEYWEDALCCSADMQLTFDSYDPYQDEVEISQENMEKEWNEDRKSFCSTFVQPDSRSVNFNNDLDTYRDNEWSVYFKTRIIRKRSISY